MFTLQFIALFYGVSAFSIGFGLASLQYTRPREKNYPAILLILFGFTSMLVGIGVLVYYGVWWSGLILIVPTLYVARKLGDHDQILKIVEPMERRMEISRLRLQNHNPTAVADRLFFPIHEMKAKPLLIIIADYYKNLVQPCFVRTVGYVYDGDEYMEFLFQGIALAEKLIDENDMSRAHIDPVCMTDETSPTSVCVAIGPNLLICVGESGDFVLATLLCFVAECGFESNEQVIRYAKKLGGKELVREVEDGLAH